MVDNGVVQSEPLVENLQHNVVTALVFYDEVALKINETISPQFFDTKIYREIVKSCIKYINTYRKAPKEHISDLLQNFLHGDSIESKNFRITLRQLHRNKDVINVRYVLDGLNEWLNRQALRNSVIQAVEGLENNESLDFIQKSLIQTLYTKPENFSSGIHFKKEPHKLLNIFQELPPPYLSGVGELDKLGIGPAKQELFVFMSPPNRGKTQFLIHSLVENARVRRPKILGVSLEMSEERFIQRIIQNACGLTTRQSEIVIPVLQRNELGHLSNINRITIERPRLIDEKTKEFVKKKVDSLIKRWNVIIKRFPTGALSILGLESYLDQLDRFEGFVPDILYIDYPDIMKLEKGDRRQEIGFIYQELRRIGVERDMAIVAPTQSNRLSEDARVITLKHLAEDYSKAATSDNIIAYCQTRLENQLGLARLFVAKARNEEKEQTILITQSYRSARFCVDSHRMENSYWDHLEAFSSESGISSDEDEDSENSSDENKPKPRFKRRKRE